MICSTYVANFELDQSIEKVFPLFSPEGEKLWVPGWDYENVMDSKELHEDYIFLTENHDHPMTKAVWIVKKYDPLCHYVAFYKIEPEEKVGLVEVRCGRLGAEKTDVEVRYTYRGLSERGDRFIGGFTPSHYEKYIGEWKKLLRKYFEESS